MVNPKGRPAEAGKARNKLLAVRLTDSEHEKIVAEAKRRNMPASVMMRKLALMVVGRLLLVREIT